MSSARMTSLMACTLMTITYLSRAGEIHFNCPWLTSPGYVSDDEGSGTKSLTLGDFDGDGFPDIVATNYYRDSLSLLKNTRMGYFDAPVTFIAPDSSPRGIASGDVDNDEDRDVVVTSFISPEITIWSNNGTGELHESTTLTIENLATHVVLADLDGDMDLDIATADYGSWGSGTTVSVLLNLGEAEFEPHAAYAVGNAPRSIKTGDIDGDGLLDLIVVNEVSDSVSTLINGGNGTFVNGSSLMVDEAPLGLDVADFDGDGDLDFAVTQYSIVVPEDDVLIFFNIGNGIFAEGGRYETGILTNSIMSGDLDQDNDVDLAVANTNSWSVSVLLNKGTGVFVVADHYATGSDPNEIAISDVDGDGRADIATANDGGEWNDLTVLLRACLKSLCIRL